MNILIISPILPHSEIGHAGGKIIYNLIKSLHERGHAVGLICRCEEKDLSYLEDIRRYVHTLDYYAGYSSLGGKVKHAVSSTIKDPFWVVGRTEREFTKAIKKHLSSGFWDVAQVEYTDTALLLPESSKIPIIVDAHDVRIRPAERYARMGKGDNWQSDPQYQRVVSEEQKAAAACDLILVRSDADRKLMKKFTATEIEIFPHPPGLDMNFEEYDKVDRIPGQILFVGAMDRDVNIEAVKFFASEVFPLVRNEIPCATFIIVGGNPSPGVLNLAETEGVIVTGFVNKLEPYYLKSSVFVAPLFVGGGVIVKILDAMISGLPVVSTEIGNEGIGATPDKEILIASTAHEFAAQVISILKNEERRKALSENAQSLMKQTYSWVDSIDRLIHMYKAIEKC